MATKILSDIHKDAKLLITAITGFEENDEGFQLCERFVLSNFKHHRYLAINSHETNKTISGLIEKFRVHGKYDVADKFQELIETFFKSFDFESHPQYDLQWSLLSFLLNLSSEISSTELSLLKSSKDSNPNFTILNESKEEVEEIDWKEYLKEGGEEFYCDYASETESEWSDDDVVTAKPSRLSVKTEISNTLVTEEEVEPIIQTSSSESLLEGVRSRNWLTANVQNSWWNELEWTKYPHNFNCAETSARFTFTKDFCNIWEKDFNNRATFISTISEYDVCRELLWMFQTQQPMVLFRKNENGKFCARENVSIPSLSVISLRNLLQPFAECFSMMDELTTFNEALYYNEKARQKPPLTYETYNEMIMQILLKVKQHICNIEKKIKKQDSNTTLLSLSRDLRHQMQIVKTVYAIHKSIISNWKTLSNWQNVALLLAMLYKEMQNSRNLYRTNLCAFLYMSCVKVYLNIIDIWLSEGRLEDWRDEFVITNDIESEFSNGQSKSFRLRSLDNICQQDPILQILVDKTSLMARNIELLVTLDRMSDMWKLNIHNKVEKVSLSQEFEVKVFVELDKYKNSERFDVIDGQNETEQVSFETHEKLVEIEEKIANQMSALDNPFLLKAFECCLLNAESQKDAVDSANSRESDNSNIYERLNKMSASVLPFREVFESTLINILDSRYQVASKLVKNILMDEYKLELHLELMRSVYMMERGNIMSQFYQQLFCEIETNPLWNNSYFLTCMLEAVLSQEWPDSCQRWSISVTEISTSKVLEAVDKISLSYTVGWPINMALTNQALVKYNKVFRFQLKLKWALWMLNNLRFSDLEGGKSSVLKNETQHHLTRRLECLRFWLLHAIESIHAYLAGQVLQSLGYLLRKALSEAQDLDAIIYAHNEYLEKVYEHCLQTDEFTDIVTTINNLLDMCLQMREKWQKGAKTLVSSQLEIMEKSYVKYHNYLALALHNAVQTKDADYSQMAPCHPMSFEQCEMNNISINSLIPDLCKNLLSDIAHQTLPPTGIALHIPITLLLQSDFCDEEYEESLDNPLAVEVSLSRYDQTFTSLRLQKSEDSQVALSSSSRATELAEELLNIIQEEIRDTELYYRIFGSESMMYLGE